MLETLSANPGLAFLLFLVFSVIVVQLYKSSSAMTRLRREVSRGQHIVPNVAYRYGVVEIKGRRPYMEDRHIEVGMLDGKPTDSLFCVFDGHGGSRASEFCTERVPELLLESAAYRKGNVERALVEAFLKTDDEFLDVAAQRHLPDGTTAVCALIRGTEVHVANAGDSRAIIVQRMGKVEPLSHDHKPNRPDEMARIKAHGGGVYFHGVWRVQGILAVSRAIGDRNLKAYVTAEPDVVRREITPADKYLVLATDGLWDVMSNEEVGEVLVGMADPQEAAARLVEYAFNRGSTDNITVVVIDLMAPQFATRGKVRGQSGDSVEIGSEAGDGGAVGRAGAGAGAARNHDGVTSRAGAGGVEDAADGGTVGVGSVGIEPAVLAGGLPSGVTMRATAQSRDKMS